MQLFTQLGWFFRREWRQYLGAITLLIAIALLQLIPPRLVGMIIDSVLTKEIDSKKLFFWFSIMITTAVLVYGLRYIWRILLFGAAYRLAVELRDRLYTLLSRQLPGFYVRHRTGDLIARATNDVDSVVFAAGEGVLMLVDSLVMGFSVLFVMSIQISWQLTLLALLPMPIMAILIKLDGQILHQRFCLAQDAFSALNNQAQENLSNIRMIKSFGLEKYQSEKFSSIAEDSGEKNMQVAKVDARFDPTIYLTVGLSNFLAVSGGSYFVIKELMTLGQLTSFMMYLGLMIWPMLALAWMFNIVERGSAAYSRIRQTLEEEIDVEDGILSIPDEKGILKVEIKKFYYPNTKKVILKDIYFNLHPGEILGLCGPIGSGKSTLLALILRHFDINEGEIYFHDLPLSNLAPDQWRSRLAVVGQTPFLFSDNIANNIALGKPDSSKDKIKLVAKLACIHNDITRFSKKYKTEIGEKGVMLSGGQKQRLAIARALLLETEILILDDALSAIDVRTGHKILQNIKNWGNGRTIIIATHRLSTLKDTNEILVLKNGYIKQRGNHQFLMKNSGWYKDMYNYQKLESNFNYKNSFQEKRNKTYEKLD